MPILSEEPDLYPESLLDDAPGDVMELSDGCSRDRRWWVVYARSRQEKAVARALWEWQIPFYLPLVPRNGIYQRRRVKAFSPLFTGYVFLFGTELERVTTLTTNRVSTILKVDNSDGLVHDLRQIRRLIASGAPLTAESRLVAGDRVRVKRGPLADMEGTVMVRRGRTRLLVQVNFLQRGASVEIDDFLLEPIA